jgi:hypothetical protein
MAYVDLLVRLALTHHKKDYDQADHYTDLAMTVAVYGDQLLQEKWWVYHPRQSELLCK